MKYRTIDPERLRAVVSYDPDTGIFRWLQQVAPIVKVGAVAGTLVADGYVRIQIDRKSYNAHRLAMFYMLGACDCSEVDHINGNRSDNRWSNLRQSDKFGNMQNKRTAQKNNAVGLLGVSTKQGRSGFIATIGAGKKKRHLGRFATPEAAHQAYIEAKKRLHGVSLV